MSTRPASRNARASVGPPSSSSDWTPSAASARSSSSSGPERSSSSEPSGSGPVPKASRRGWRFTSTSRASRRGFSRRTVPMPTATASDAARSSWTRRRDVLARDPALARHGDPPVERHRRLVGDERPAEGDPGSPRLVLAPRLEAVGVLDLDPVRPEPLEPALRLGVRVERARRRHATTPAASTASTHGGVVPWWVHGSIVTKRVAPRASSPAASSATISPWRPLSSVAPSPTTSPSATITAPTVGFG